MTESSSSQIEASPRPALSYADASTPQLLTRGDVAAIAVRLLGLYCAIEGISAFAQVMAAWWYTYGWQAWSQYAYVIAYGIVFETAGLFLLIKGAALGRLILSKASNPTPLLSVPISVSDLQSAAFGVVGIVLVVFSAPTIAYWVAKYAYEVIKSLPHESEAPGLFNKLFPPVARCALGLWLFYGSKRLALYWQRIRAVRPPGEDSGPL